MNRDCGKGKLIPIRYELVWCVGQSDDETKRSISDPSSIEYDELLATLPPFSNISMYACDKQGYANCIRSTFIDAKGVVTEGANRLAEL